MPDDECVFCYETCDGGTGTHSIFLLIDISGSMNTNNRLANAKEGANYFVDLVASNSAANPNFTTKIGLISYNSTAHTLVNPTTGYDNVHDAINALTA